MIKNKKIIAVLCAATITVSLGLSVSADTKTKNTAQNSDGNTIYVDTDGTWGAMEKQKQDYANFANYVDSLVSSGDLRNEDAEAIKQDAAKIIIAGGNIVDGVYDKNDPTTTADAQLIINKVVSSYNPDATYKPVFETENDIEQELTKTNSGSGFTSSQKIDVTITEHFKVEESSRDKNLIDMLFKDQSAETVQEVINDTSSLNQGTKNKLQQIGETGASVNCVIYGTEDFRSFCAARNLNYDEAWQYLLTIKDDPKKAYPCDQALASNLHSFFNVTDGQAYATIEENIKQSMRDSTAQLEEAKRTFQEMFLYDRQTQKYIYFVDDDAGTSYMTEQGDMVEIGTDGNGTYYTTYTKTTIMEYFNVEKYDPDRMIATLKILFPEGDGIIGKYESYIRGSNGDIPDSYDDFMKLLNDISTEYYGEGVPPYDFSLYFQSSSPPYSIVLSSDIDSGVTSELTATAEAGVEIHRTVDRMCFELERIDLEPILPEERGYTDAEIFASLYNMYFTQDIREQSKNEGSMFTILDLYMQLHAQIYGGRVGMPPVSMSYRDNKLYYTIDFKSGIEKMAKDAGISYLDFVRNYFSYYERPTLENWMLVPSMHTYGFYPQSATQESGKLPQMATQLLGAKEHNYIGSIHKQSFIRSQPTMDTYFNNSGNVIRAIGKTGTSPFFDDKHLKTDNVNPVLLTLRPEISTAYNVHVWVEGTGYNDGTHFASASSANASEGKSWTFYPYREIFMSEGGKYTSYASYSEKWGPLSVGDNVLEAQTEQTNIAIEKGSKQLVESIIDTNNKQFSTGRGDIASYYNYVIYNGKNTSAMPESISHLSERWINTQERGYEDLTEEEKLQIENSEGHISLEQFQYRTISAGATTLKIPIDQNGKPLYIVDYAPIKCAYENGGSSTSWSDQQNTNSNFVNSLGSMYGTCTDEEIAGNLQSLGINIPSGSQFTYTNSSGQTVTTTPSGVLNTLMSEVAFGGKNAQDVAQEYGSLFGGSSDETTEGAEGGTEGSESTESSGGSSSAPRGPKHPCPEGVPDNCVYFAECCTRWFTATWNPQAIVPYIVMDDVSPLMAIGYSTDITNQGYESNRLTTNVRTFDEPDTVWHWRWSQTLEADPNKDKTTPFETTMGTLPAYTDPINPNNPLFDPDPPMQTTPNRNPGNPDETTYRTTGGDLPPMPTPITIPPADDPNKGNIVIEQFISK